MNMRVSIFSIPTTPTPCPETKCVYHKEGNGICADPRINKGNGDARCHHWNNKDLLAKLAPPKET